MAASGKPTNEPGNYLAFGKQASKDTDATTFFFLKQLSGSGFDPTQDVTSEREGGDGQEIGLRYKTRIRSDGQAIVNARPEVAGRLFAWTLGQDTMASVVSGATLADHTAVPVASLPYITVEQRFADEMERFDNGQFTGLTVEGEAGRPLKLTANFVSGGSVTQRDVGSALTPVREALPPFFFPGGSYAFDGAGSYAQHITKFRVEIRRNVEQVQTTGLNDEDVIPVNFEVTLDATVKYSSRDFYQKVQYGAAGSQVPIALSTGSFQLFTANGSYQLTVGVPVLTWNDAKVAKLDPDGKVVYMDLTAGGIKNATNQIFAITRTDEQVAY